MEQSVHMTSMRTMYVLDFYQTDLKKDKATLVLRQGW